MVLVPRLTIGLLLITSMGACMAYKKPPPEAPAADAYSRSEQGRVMIRSGSLSLRVKELDVTKSRIEQIARGVDGRIDDSSTQDGKWLNMTLRVPETKLDETMDQIATLGKVVGRSLRSRDVTEELIDLEARLSNLRALRDRLRIYLEKTSKLEEILAVERELARVQTEIESLEAKLKVLKDQIAMSELDVRATKGKWF